ncbi:MAG: thioredoxin family protein [Desulfobacterales bacterium]|nr:thioredoxin family protein [Desulfobacterales bacterium]
MNNQTIHTLAGIVLGLALVAGLPAPAPAAPVEVGDVTWGRSLEAAQRTARETQKPILILFQEVPGCQGCRTFGRDVLTHPLLVEAMEDEFVPLLIHNNTPGEDARLLKYFKEPAWNYQVIRFFDADLKEIIPRRDRVWNLGGVARRMALALGAAGKRVPPYLTTLANLEETDQHREVIFAMACFWVGEFELGRLPGVLTTEAGWYDGREVTRVVFHNRHTSLEKLVDQAARVDCARRVYLPRGTPPPTTRLEIFPFDARNYRRADPGDQKKQIQNWKALKAVPHINAQQLTRLNAWAPIDRARALDWLSPRQQRHLK